MLIRLFSPPTLLFSILEVSTSPLYHCDSLPCSFHFMFLSFHFSSVTDSSETIEAQLVLLTMVSVWFIFFILSFSFHFSLTLAFHPLWVPIYSLFTTLFLPSSLFSFMTPLTPSVSILLLSSGFTFDPFRGFKKKKSCQMFTTEGVGLIDQRQQNTGADY